MRKSSGVLSLGVVALLLLPACKGGGSDAPPPPPVTGGAGFAPATGPGDTEHYFPNALGDTWYLNVSSSDPADPPAHPFTSISVTGTRSVFGVQASVLSEGSGISPLESYYYKSPGGVTFLGTNDPTDLLTAQTVPNPELLFPPVVGPIASFTRTGLNFGEDLDGDGIPEKIDLTQSYAINGIHRGLGLPLPVMTDLAPDDPTIPHPTGRPAVATDGTRFLVLGRRATGTSPTHSVNWRGTLWTLESTGEGASFDVTAPVPTTQPTDEVAMQAAPAFDGMNYLAVLGTPGDVQHPVVAFDGTNYLVLWSQAAWDTQVHGIQGTRISPGGAVLDPAGILVQSTLTAGQLLDGTPAGSGFPVTTAPGVQTFNVSLARTQGETWIVWQEAPGIGLYPSLRGARIKSEGSQLSGSGRGDLWLGPPWHSRYPRLAAHATGGLLVWLVPEGMATVPSLAGLPIHPFGP